MTRIRGQRKIQAAKVDAMFLNDSICDFHQWLGGLLNILRQPVDKRIRAISLIRGVYGEVGGFNRQRETVIAAAMIGRREKRCAGLHIGTGAEIQIGQTVRCYAAHVLD